METTIVQASPEVVRAFLDEYFLAWRGTDLPKVLTYYADDVVLQIPTGHLTGKTAVRDNFVAPLIEAFPGNSHVIQNNLVHGPNIVAVEWIFDAVHTGPFATVPATGNHVQVPGCAIYEYNLAAKVITRGRIYFDFGTLMRQIGA
jgi:steroid delta-isomerase-like uncharacterized protein